MERILILAVVLSILSNNGVFSQNLLLNGDFEEINRSDDSPKYYLHHFYAQDWFEPTDCSVDIYRDFKACDEQHISNIENLDFCVQAASGMYCLGFCTITPYGYMEHITGKIKEPLQAGEVYKISFALRFYGDEPYFSKGLGYKLSVDSIVFNSDIVFEKKMSPFYPDLLGKHKVYADFQFDEYLTDSSWQQYVTYYPARGGERFITFGQFAFQDDKKVIWQMENQRHNPNVEKLKKFVNSGESVYIQKIASVTTNRQNGVSENYYLLDNVRVEKVSEDEKRRAEITCPNCIDSDPVTIKIPSKRLVTVDKGFFGDLSFELDATLLSSEKFVIELDKNRKIIIVNQNLQTSGYHRINYRFKYPAKKLMKKPMALYIEKTSLEEVKTLEASIKGEIYFGGNSSWIVFKNNFN